MVDYYERVVKTMGGEARATDFTRLFMAPGMEHCRGGPGPNMFDAFGALVQWVEQGVAPNQLLASKVEQGEVTRTRPLCPYPQQAAYKGSGSTDDAANFVCTRALPGATPPLPKTGNAAAPSQTFPATGYSLEGEFLRYWQANGSLPVFGYPISSARQASGQVSQWLERTRFELHPQNKPPYEVLLGRIGVEALERQGRDWQAFPKADVKAAYYFKETGQAIAPQFWEYWRTHGLEFDGQRGTSLAESVALFGYPISPARMETNANGDTVLTQWFERARFEYHPRNPSAYRVLLGRLGAELQVDRER